MDEEEASRTNLTSQTVCICIQDLIDVTQRWLFDSFCLVFGMARCEEYRSVYEVWSFSSFLIDRLRKDFKVFFAKYI
jgi:hypothetical protein